VNVTVRALTTEEARWLTAARLVAIEHAPYLAHALFATRSVAAESLGTFAVDRHWRLYLDPSTLAAWGPQLAGGVLVHEVGHLVRAHAERADALGADRDHERWNVAADAALNDDLIEAGVPLPEGVVTPGGLGLAAGGIEEAYYAALAPRQRPAMPDAASCGSGAGDPSASWELPSDDPTAPGIGPADASMTRAAGNAGRTRPWPDPPLPGGGCWPRPYGGRSPTPPAATTYTYSRPARRRIPRVVTPAMRRPLVTVAVVVDTSGSMGQAEVDAALAEVRGVIRAAGIGSQQLLVLACDAAVGATSRVRRVEDVQLVGGGGTDMRVGIGAAEASRPQPDVVVVFTDGYTPWPEHPTRARLIVALIGGQAAETAPSWATTVCVSPA